MYMYVRDTVIILEDGNLSHPWCPRCDMLVMWKALNGWHLTTAQCEKRDEQKWRRLAAEEIRESVERAFQSCCRSLGRVTLFK